MLVTHRKFTLRTRSTINQQGYFSAPICNRAAQDGSIINAKGTVPGSPFFTSLLHFHRFSLQCIFTKSWHILKITNGQIIQIYTRLLCLGPLQRVVCRKRVESSVYSFLLTFFLISQSTTSFRVAHIHVSALVREERSKPYTKRIKRVFKLRALHTLRYLTTYFLLCGRLATAICLLKKIKIILCLHL